jgi:hypothetical protein
LLKDLDLAAEGYSTLKPIGDCDKSEEFKYRRSKRINRESFIKHIQDLKAQMELLIYQNKFIVDNAVEDSIHTPRSEAHSDPDQVLWADIEKSLTRKGDMDDEEKEEFRKTLTKQK